MQVSDLKQTKAPSSFRRFLIIRMAILTWIGLGAYLTYFHASAYLTSRQSEHWPSVTGVLSINQGFLSKSLSYTYAVNGKAYTSDRITFGELGNRTSSQPWQSISLLPNGSEVKVYYRASRPEESSLATRLHEGSRFQLMLGLAIFLSGGVLLLLSPIIRRKV